MREDNILCLFTPGCVPHLHPIILLLVTWPSQWVPHLHPIIHPLVPCPFQGVPHLHPIILPQVQGPLWRGTLAMIWWSTPPPHPGLDWGTPLPLPSWDRLRLDWLRRGHYTSCSFPQDDFLVTKMNSSLLLFQIILWTQPKYSLPCIVQLCLSLLLTRVRYEIMYVTLLSMSRRNIVYFLISLVAIVTGW